MACSFIFAYAPDTLWNIPRLPLSNGYFLLTKLRTNYDLETIGKQNLKKIVISITDKKYNGFKFDIIPMSCEAESGVEYNFE